jgi:hypothetical protein
MEALMLQVAFKEWAVICRALADGKQALILRKGGIAETDGEFRLEQRRFWLFPTFAHQQNSGIREDARPLLEEVLAERPAAGLVRLSHFAEVTGIYKIHEFLPAMMISHLHLWSDETVEQRFAYRSPGLNVFSVRVYRAAQVHEIADTPAYQGCRSWVQLEQPLETDPATPVLSDADYHDVQVSLDLLLTPPALA